MNWLRNLLNLLFKLIPAPEPDDEPDLPSTGDPTVEAMINAHNKYRADRHLPILASLVGLNRAAQKWAAHMAKTNSMTHGTNMAARISDEGVNWSAIGENIAAGYETVPAAMQGWINSRGHHANIINPQYRAIGVGYARSSRGVLYWCVDFAGLRSGVRATSQLVEVKDVVPETSSLAISVEYQNDVS